MEAVYDESGTDFLWTKCTVNGGFLVNGQIDVFGNMPGTSYAQAGPGIDLDAGIGGFARAPAADNAAIAAQYPPGLRGFPGAGLPPTINLSQVVGLGATQDLRTNVDRQPDGSAIPNPPGVNSPSAGVASGVPRFEYRIVPASVPPNMTAWVIRERLNTPRAPLFCFFNTGIVNELLVASPVPGAPCDANGGPKPIVFHITNSVGVASLFCNFQVETYLAESLANAGTTPALLSNRFKQSEYLDEQYGIVRITEGTSIFRADAVYGGVGLNPDALRSWVFPPIANGYVRRVDVSGSENGQEITWRCEDRQQHANFPAGVLSGATKVQLVHRQSLQASGSPLGGVLSQVERYYNFRWLQNPHGEPRNRPEAEHK
ncbi:MAG: hypothetical protein JWO38_933 [Gemmataceae bacterium]|nr:hypothetical protein [Gemmataceae bacterium]